MLRIDNGGPGRSLADPLNGDPSEPHVTFLLDPPITSKSNRTIWQEWYACRGCGSGCFARRGSP